MVGARQRPHLWFKLFACPGVPPAGWLEAWGGGRTSYPPPESLISGEGEAGEVKGHLKLPAQACIEWNLVHLTSGRWNLW